MSVKKTTLNAIMLSLIGLYLSCKTEDKSVIPTTTSTTVPDVYKKIYGATSVTSDGTFVTIKTVGVPDHESPYYATTNALYKAYVGKTFGGTEFKKNPNVIANQTLTFKLPINPKESATHAATALGPIGVALNGVAFYNQYAGPNNQVLTTEIASFDKYYGHPTATSQYHYHVEPLYLTTVKSTKSGLMGFLMDGFPVYGPNEESGKAVANSDLDVYHGHTHTTVDFPNGTYHYHFTADAPYLNGNGYYGTAGTLTQ
jgi:YHYH protein